MYITPAKKKYLTAIKRLQRTGEELKAVTLAQYLGVSKPSVSIMLRQLEKDGLVSVYTNDKTRIPRLSPAGENAVQQIEKHCRTLEKMLQFFGVPAASAQRDALSLEPYLSDETYASLTIQ
jgi:DtxR family transcriptional regulator, Mn-dependent transcriptional regulator